MNNGAIKTFLVGAIAATLTGAATGLADYLTHAPLLAVGGIGAIAAGLLAGWAYRVIPAHFKTEGK